VAHSAMASLAEGATAMFYSAVGQVFRGDYDDAADVARQARDADPGQVASWINELAEIGAHHPGVLRLVAILNATGDGT